MANLLLVDDNAELLELTRRVLERDGHSCTVAHDVGEAIVAGQTDEFELIVCDLLMPDASGLTFLARVAALAPATAAVVMTAVNEVGVADQALDLGVYGYVVKPVDPSTLLIAVRTALRRRESELQADRLTREMTELVHRRTEALMATIDTLRLHAKELNREHEEAIHSLTTASEFRGLTRTAHTYRVGRFCAIMAKSVGFEQEVSDRIRVAAALHDVGNVGIPREILSQRGELDAEARQVMETHTRIGFRILSGYGSPMMKMAAEIALTHHERWDGTGYPQGLSGPSTPLAGRIAAIADVFDAMLGDRPHREALSADDAFTFIQQGAGTLFDPELVRVFLSLRPEVERLLKKYRDRLEVSTHSESEFPGAG